MAQDPPGWYRYESEREGALFLHNPATGKSLWFNGWIQRKSRMYARNYWFQPTTGRAEWELPVEAPSLAPKAAPRGEEEDVPSRENPTKDKVKMWSAKIKASKEAEAVVEADGRDKEGSGFGKAHKRRREAERRQNDGSSGDDMEVDNDMDIDDDLGGAATGAPPLPPVPPGFTPGMPQVPSYPPHPPLPQPPTREDSPYVAVRRETLRKKCLNHFAEKNTKFGAMGGYSKTSRSCREEGMAIGLSGMFGRFLWVQHMRQTLALASGVFRRASKAPPDPVFPSVTEGDSNLIKELVEGNRSKSEAEWVLEELASVCRLVAAELEALLETQQLRLREQVVTLHVEVTTPKGDTRLQPVTGNGSRIPGPNPNASYALRYAPPRETQERESCLSITGTHLRKTWMAYCHLVHGTTVPVWDSDFLRRLFCVLSRYETLSATSDGYQMAFPAAGFALLQELVGVECECFASPLNCTLRRFCSVAYDTDRFFGSEGNFFLSKYQEGSFEANPPFVEEVIDRMVDHMHYLLKRATGPMSFAIIVPGWDDSSSYQKMMKSPFARPHQGFHLKLMRGDHNYRPGMQHRHDIEEKPSNCNTFLFILQNDEGAGRWPVSTTSLLDMKNKLQVEARKHVERNFPSR